MKIRPQRTILAALAAIALSAWLAIAGGQQKATATRQAGADELLGAAQYQEQIEGKLEAAVATYRKVLAAPDATREQRARAQFSIGACYERLGLGEARKAYEAVVANFAEEAALAAEAKARLAALGESRSKISGSAMTVRRVWSGPGIDLEGEISPDGKYLSFVDWGTGDLAILDLETGAKRQLTDKGSWKEPLEYAYASRWAPDGKQIVYEWYDAHGYELRLVNVDSPKPRFLYRSKQREYVGLCDWSSDGKHILAFEESPQDRTSNIVLISADDGTARGLKTVHGSFEGSPRLSPDGRYVALDLPQRDAGAKHDIVVFPVDSGREAALVSHPANDWVLDWSPDGNWLVFASDRTGSLGIWAIQVVDGAAKGDPQLVKAGLPDMIPMGLTRRGSLCYGQASRNENVYVAKLDPRTGKVTGRPEEVTERFEGLCGSPAYSPDGRYLAYACSRGPILGWRGRNILRIHSLETGKDRELSTEFASIHYPRWLPDSRFMLVSGHDDNGAGLYRIDTQTWEMKLVFGETPAGEPSPDGKGLFYAKREKDNGLCRILFRDFEKGQEKELYRGSWAEMFNVSLSPDGRWLAFLNRTNPRILRLIPSEGGRPREVFRFGLVGDANILMAWTADGKYILFSKPLALDASEERWDLWRVPVDGGEAERLDLGMRCDDPSVHPDGRHIAFSSSGGISFDEVWVMENFLAALKPVR